MRHLKMALTEAHIKLLILVLPEGSGGEEIVELVEVCIS